MKTSLLFRKIFITAFLIVPFLACQKASDNQTHQKIPNESLFSEQGTLSSQIDILLSGLRTVFGDSVIGSDEKFKLMLDSVVAQLRPAIEMEDDPGKKIDHLNRLIFNKWNIEFDPDQDELSNILPHLVLETRSGSCLGISMLYLLLGEKLELPLTGVMVPGHFFIRLGESDTVLNIETMKNGEIKTDGWYREKYWIPDTGYYDFHSMKLPEVMAVVRYSIGNVCLANKMYLQAVFQYQAALKLKPVFAEAQGNMALGYDASGDCKTALDIINKVKGDFPWLKNIGKNRASILVRCGLYSSAASQYEEVLSGNPLDFGAYYGLGTACYYLKDYEKSLNALDSAIFINPDYQEAVQLRERVSALRNRH